MAKTKRLVDRIKTLTTQPIKYVIVGADHGDHVAGNSAFPAGVTFIAHPTSRAAIEAMATRPQPTGAGPMPVPQETVADKRVPKLAAPSFRFSFWAARTPVGIWKCSSRATASCG